MMEEGYELAFVEENGIAAAAIGFHYQQKLFDGKQIYVDDLTTLAEHRKINHYFTRILSDL